MEKWQGRSSLLVSLCLGIPDTSSLVPDITGISYSLVLSLPKNFVFVFLNLFADGFLSSLPTSENFTDFFSFSVIRSRSGQTETVCLGLVMGFGILLWHVFAVLVLLLLLCRTLVYVADRRILEDEQRLW